KSVPLECHLEPEVRFTDLLTQVNESTGDILGWQEYFDWGSLGGSNPSATTPFFPVMFEFDERPECYWAGDVRFTIQRLYTCNERFALKLSCVQTADVLSMRLHYDCNALHLQDI